MDANGKWRKCSVCDCDPTWPCITRSDAARSTVTHNCRLTCLVHEIATIVLSNIIAVMLVFRLCGNIVCSVCSPSGDDVPGEGVGTFERLSDMRIPLPSIGKIAYLSVALVV